MPPSRRYSARLLAVATAAAVVAMPIAATAQPPAGSDQPAAQPSQVAQIPADPPPAVPYDDLVFAGASGFLHHFSSQYGIGGEQYLWTSYATGATVAVPQVADASYVKPDGGDSVTLGLPPVSGGNVDIFDLATMTWTYLAVPAGNRVDAVYGNSVIAEASPGGTPVLQLLSYAADGSHTTTQVTGLPGGAVLLSPATWTGDSTDAVLDYVVGNDHGAGLLDLATGVLTPIGSPTPDWQAALLTPTTVGLYDSDSGQISVYSLTDLAGSPQTATVPSGRGTIALAGDDVLTIPTQSTCAGCPVLTAPVTDTSLTGAPASEALPQAQSVSLGLMQATDGSVVVVGGTGPADWAVRKLTSNGSGQLIDSVILPLTGPLGTAGLTISQGLVRHIETEPTPAGAPEYWLFNHALDANTVEYDWPPTIWVDGGSLPTPLSCGGACVTSVDGNAYGTSYLTPGTEPGTIDLREQWAADASSMSLQLPSAGGTIVAASPDFVVVDGTSPDRQYVVDVGQQQVVVTRSVTGAALWYDTLWSADGPGRLLGAIPGSKSGGEPISTGVRCTATEIQASLRWIYWSCGAAGPAGVYDLRHHVDITVPAGPMLLGDGYLVHQDAGTGDLVMFDVHTDAVTGPVTLATNVQPSSAPDTRDITWAVDKFGGDVAYVTTDNAVVVIDTGVPATPTAIGIPADVAQSTVSPGSATGWSVAIALTRPVTSWKLTIRHGSGGPIVHTESGGAARLGIWVDWNGRLANRAKAASGPYHWTLAVVAAGLTSPATAGTGVVTVVCGQPPFRSYDCDGEPALLAVKADGQGHWFNGTPTGGLADNGYTDTWQLGHFGANEVSAIVPFGDFNGDGFNDLLVRQANGVLRAYLGFGQSYFNSQVVKSIKIGSGWSRYNALVAPGELGADGHPDLLARDATGKLWRYASTGRGTFSSRVMVGAGFGRYVKLVGAGDLTGSGIGDLLAVTASGVMWRFDGNGTGGLDRPVRVGPGWQKYNTIIGIGDLNQDGRNDLVARDASGRLWFFAGDGHGGFARRRLISGGWQRFQALF